MAERFKTNPAVHRFFLDLHDEEMEHGRLMLVCLDQVAVNREVDCVPGVRDRAMRESLNALRDIERRVPAMSLEEAFKVTNELEAGEVDVIFGRLLTLVGRAETELFAEQLKGAQSHPASGTKVQSSERRELAPIPIGQSHQQRFTRGGVDAAKRRDRHLMRHQHDGLAIWQLAREERLERGQIRPAIPSALEEGVEGRQRGDRPEPQQLGRLQAAAPFARIDPRMLDPVRPQPNPDGSRLLAPGIVQVALGCAVV